MGFKYIYKGNILFVYFFLRTIVIIFCYIVMVGYLDLFMMHKCLNLTVKITKMRRICTGCLENAYFSVIFQSSSIKFPNNWTLSL